MHVLTSAFAHSCARAGLARERSTTRETQAKAPRVGALCMIWRTITLLTPRLHWEKNEAYDRRSAHHLAQASFGSGAPAAREWIAAPEGDPGELGRAHARDTHRHR